MPTAPTPQRPAPLLRARTIFALWNGVYLVAMAHYLLATATGKVPFMGSHFAWNLVIINLWALATPAIAYLCQRYPVAGAQALRHAGVHAAGAVAASVVTTLAFMGVKVPYELLAGKPFAFVESFLALQIRSLFLDFVLYAAAAAVLHALDFRRQSQEREVRAAQLETQLVQAQVHALRMQLNPHFLFNTLHAISSLMDDDVRKARRMLVDLSDLLRISLDSVGEQEVPLEQELAFLERYLQIEKVRFGDRLTVEMDVDEEALDALVPNLLLQPLVENALKHAVAPFAGPGRIAVRARATGTTLRLEVEDDGPGLPPAHGDGAHAGDGAPGPAEPARGGLGLRNTRERLDRLYGDEHRFALHSPPGHGLTVRLVLPFRTSPTLTPA